MRPAQHIAGGVTINAASWKVCVTGNITQSSPSVLTYDGRTLVAIGDESGEVHVLNAATGQEIRGWPKMMAAPAGEHAAIESSPTFAFFDGAHKAPSIVATSGSTWVKNSVGEVEAFHLDGAKRFVFQVGAATGTAVGVVGSPAVGALTGHGRPDIVFGSWDHEIYALDSAGHLVPGFPLNNADTIWSSPALYQLPGVVGEDIYLGSDASGLKGCVGGFITDYRYTGGAPQEIWQHCLDQVVWSSPAVGSFGDPSNPVVVVGTGYYRQPFPDGTDKLYAYDARTGATVPGWPVTTSGPVYGSPAIGDLGSGTAVVDVAWKCTGAAQSTCFGSNSSTVAAWSTSGRQLWSQELLGPTALGSPILVPLAGRDGERRHRRHAERDLPDRRRDRGANVRDEHVESVRGDQPGMPGLQHPSRCGRRLRRDQPRVAPLRCVRRAARVPLPWRDRGVPVADEPDVRGVADVPLVSRAHRGRRVVLLSGKSHATRTRRWWPGLTG